DFHVTGVQTCALPIYKIANDILADFSDAKHEYLRPTVSTRELLYHFCSCVGKRCGTSAEGRFLHHALVSEEDGVHQPVEKRSGRSEERRVGKEGRNGW